MPKQWWVGDGPIEPRLVSVKGKLFISFNAAMAFKVQNYMDWTVSTISATVHCTLHRVYMYKILVHVYMYTVSMDAAPLTATYRIQFFFKVLWDYDLNLPLIPRIKGGSPMVNATEKNDMPRDKHWMALVQDDELYFVHNLDPLRVMHCDLDAYCEFVHNEVRMLDLTTLSFVISGFRTD